MSRLYCSSCGKSMPRYERVCPHCGTPVPPEKIEIFKNIENYEKRRNTLLATLVLGTFGIWLLPFTNIRILLAIAAYCISPVMIVYYTWRKKEMEKKLTQSREDSEK